MLKRLQVSLAIDCGANVGQYATELRKCGYTGRIISFEPGSGAYKALAENAKGDPDWQPFRKAVGDSNQQLMLNVTANSVASSLLKPEANEFNASVGAVVVDAEQVEMVRLDEFVASHAGDHTSIFLKLDVQGFEPKALDGASGLMHRVRLIEIELGLARGYEGAGDWVDMVGVLRDYGFELVGVQPQTFDQLTRAREVNALFEKIEAEP